MHPLNLNTNFWHRYSKWLTFVDQALVSGSNFLVSIQLAVYLGMDTFGQFAGTWLIVLFCSSLHQAFVTMPMFTLHARQTNKAQYLNQLTSIQLVVSLSATVISFAGMYAYNWFAHNTTEFVVNDLLLSIIIGLFLWQDFARKRGLLENKIKHVLLMDFIVFGMQPVLFFMFYWMEGVSLVMVFMGMIALYSLSLLVTFRISSLSKLNKETLLVVFEQWNFGRFLVLSACLQWFTGNSFLIIGSQVLTHSEFAAIRIVQNLMGMLTVFFQFLENTIPVRLAQFVNTVGVLRMRKELIRIGFHYSLPFVGFLLLMIIFRSEILALFYGSENSHYAWLIPLFCALQLFIYVGTFARFYLRTIERNSVIFIGYIFATLFSFLMANPLISSFGINGVMVGLFSCQLLILSPLVWMKKPILAKL